ncbi:MAG: ABC transporter ATP-binding protein [Sphaerochaetaceae bacterium]|jgi:ATP-binding cassette subfamily B protein
MTNLEIPRIGGPKVGGPSRFGPREKPKHGKQTAKRLLVLFMESRKAVVAGMSLTTLSAAIGVAAPLVIGKTFDLFSMTTRQVDFPRLGILLTALFFLYLVNWACSSSGGIIVLKISQNLVHRIRARFFAKMQRLSLSFYDTHSRGDTMSRITSDVDTISLTIAQSATQLSASILTLVFSLFVMIYLNLTMTICILGCIPLVWFLTHMIATRSRTNFLGQQRSLGAIDGLIEEHVQQLKMVKAFGKERDVLARFDVENARLKEYGTKAQIHSGFMMPMMNVINNLTFSVIAIVGGVLCTKGMVSIGVVVSFLSYAKHFASPLNQVAGLFNNIQSALAGAERIFEVMDAKEEEKDGKDAICGPFPRGDVSFQNVSFSYDGNRRIIKNISFHVDAGSHIALVGETGSGKTTIVNLLSRFYDCSSGSVKIDGHDVRSYRREDLHDNLSVVLQDTCLFTGTIAENIRYAVPKASFEQVKAAARLAHADAFIEMLPDGYDTHIYGNADRLSEGQRQQLAIARAALRPAPILILDEATSSVDTKTEKEIQHAMIGLMEHRTTFLIAHRLSTIRDADRIFVIDDGRIVQEGDHVSLMATDGVYRKMVLSQSGISTVQ